MRFALVILTALIAVFFSDSAHADPYKWCAVYGGGGEDGGGTNCYFLTLEQCRAAISGMGGFCTPNPFYDGHPVVTPEQPAPSHRKRSR
jgi:hypothetical protein